MLLRLVSPVDGQRHLRRPVELDPVGRADRPVPVVQAGRRRRRADALAAGVDVHRVRRAVEQPVRVERDRRVVAASDDLAVPLPVTWLVGTGLWRRSERLAGRLGERWTRSSPARAATAAARRRSPRRSRRRAPARSSTGSSERCGDPSEPPRPRSPRAGRGRRGGAAACEGRRRRRGRGARTRRTRWRAARGGGRWLGDDRRAAGGRGSAGVERRRGWPACGGRPRPLSRRDGRRARLGGLRLRRGHGAAVLGGRRRPVGCRRRRSMARLRQRLAERPRAARSAVGGGASSSRPAMASPVADDRRRAGVAHALERGGRVAREVARREVAVGSAPWPSPSRSRARTPGTCSLIVPSSGGGGSCTCANSVATEFSRS